MISWYEDVPAVKVASAEVNLTVDVPGVNVPPEASQLPSTVIVSEAAVKVPTILTSSADTFAAGAKVCPVNTYSSLPPLTVKTPAVIENLISASLKLPKAESIPAIVSEPAKS